MRIALLCYDFPHWKTQQFLLAMVTAGYRPDVAISFAHRDIQVPESLVKPQHIGVLHPREICRALCILYYEPVDDMVNLLKWANIDIGVISGARILKRPVWEACKKGIINIHPGMIPEARGLDCIRWSVYWDIPLGVSAHFIDERVDAGRLITRRAIPLYPNDTWLSIRLRLDETQVAMASEAIKLVEDQPVEAFPVVETSGRAFQHMTEKEVSEIDLEEYLRRHSI